MITAPPYPSTSRSRITLAMSVDGERRVASITGKHWRAVARRVELPPQALIERIEELASRVPDALNRVIAENDSYQDTKPL